MDTSDRGSVLAERIPGPIHFIGIGGYGMSGLALVLVSLGLSVTGCDLAESSRVKALRSRGIEVAIGHHRDHLEGVATVVYSTDVPGDNVERVEAGIRGIPVLHRSRILAALFDAFAPSIAVAGTHGKTSSTGMLGAVLEASGLDPTVVVGGELMEEGLTARIGSSGYLVAEACESDGTFLHYHPDVALCTNVEPEHLEFYGGSFPEQVRAFGQFVEGIRSGGLAVINAEDPILLDLASGRSTRVVYCAAEAAAADLDIPVDYVARDLCSHPGGSEFNLWCGSKDLGRIALRIPGRHMAQNALLVAAAAVELGADPQSVAEGLWTYRGVGRRFETVGRNGGARVVDDYAHHPTEIRATLAAARDVAAGGRVLAVFQPQRHTRTRDLMAEFGASFDDADFLVIMPIYAPAGQQPIPGVSSETMANLVRRRTDMEVVVCGDRDGIVADLRARVRPGDVVVTMGAGDVWKLARELVSEDSSGVEGNPLAGPPGHVLD